MRTKRPHPALLVPTGTAGSTAARQRPRLKWWRYASASAGSRSCWRRLRCWPRGRHEIVGIIGPNGAGKTTLFDLISGFTRADAGRVVLGGQVLTGRGPDQRARLGLGRSFQDAQLFPALTVEETIAVAMDRWVAVKLTHSTPPCTCPPPLTPSRPCAAKRVSELIGVAQSGRLPHEKFVHELSSRLHAAVV